MELHENHNVLPFLAEEMKIGSAGGEGGGAGLVPNFKDKKGYGVHIKALD